MNRKYRLGISTLGALFVFLASLFDWVMAFLKGEWTNRNILKECMIDNK
jgi:hypothetical protein